MKNINNPMWHTELHFTKNDPKQQLVPSSVSMSENPCLSRLFTTLNAVITLMLH